MNNDHVGLIFLIIMGALTFTGVWLMYIVQAHTENAESLLSNSHFVRINKAAFSHMGFFGKVIRCGVLTMILMMPEISTRRGIVIVAEVERFPKGLKRILVLSWGVFWLLGLVFFVFGVYVKYIL